MGLLGVLARGDGGGLLLGGDAAALLLGLLGLGSLDFHLLLGGLVVLAEHGAADHLLHHHQQGVGDPVHTHARGHAEADKQRHAGPQQEQGQVHLGGRLVLAHLVGLLHDQGGHQGQSGGDDGQQEQPDGAPGQPALPELQLGDQGQVDAEEVEVDDEHAGGGHPGGGRGVLGGGQVARFHHGAQGQLVIAHGGEVRPAQGLAHGGGGRLGEVHHVLQRAADDGVQRPQDEHGDHGPAAAPHGVDVVLGVELLNLLVILLPVVAAALLDLLKLAVHHVHFDHALLALQMEGEEDDLHHHGEQDQRDAVAVEHLAEQLEQQAERGHEDLPNIHVWPPKFV